MTRRSSLSIAVCVLLTAGAIFAADDKPAEDFASDEPYMDFGDVVQVRNHLLKEQLDFLEQFQKRR